MPSPLIQIVDADDKPVSAATIEQAQKNGLRHRVVRIMVEDPAGDILLQKRATNSYMYPDCWDNSAAGHVDEGEDYETAAKRELFEEIGLGGVELREIGYYQTQRKYEGRQLDRFNRIYKVVVPRDTKFALQVEEVSDIQWFTPADFKQLVEQAPDQITDGIVEFFDRFYS